MRRRYFLGAAVAALGAGCAPAWADIAGHEPLCLTAGNRPDNSTFLIGLSLGGRVLFSHPLPGRGHAAAVHPDRAEAVAFARRPGRFGLVIDCATGREIARLETPEETHFYGHGAFTADGRFLLTTENAFDIPDGRIGIWDAEKRYTRVDDVASGGLGPHEIIRLASGAFAVANGGIRTHPAFPRAKLNLPDMMTGLAVLSESGELLEDWRFDGSQPAAQQGALPRNSIRHIAEDARGGIVAALQWQGDPRVAVPLAARFTPGHPPEVLDHPDTPALTHYAGSVAVAESGTIAVTGPKGGRVLFFDQSGRAAGSTALTEASGVARAPEGLAITCAGGLALAADGDIRRVPVEGDWRWDNHLVRVG